MSHACRRAIFLCACAAALVCGLPGHAWGQDVTLPALKAAFISNFAKFTEWPPDTPGKNVVFNFCVVGDDAVAAALKQIVGNKDVKEVLNVLAPRADRVSPSCQLLYVSRSDQARIEPLLAAVRDTPVFTVSDTDQFLAHGGVAQLVVAKDRMRFAINITAARRARLQLSAKLLTLAILVKDPDNGS